MGDNLRSSELDRLLLESGSDESDIDSVIEDEDGSITRICPRFHNYADTNVDSDERASDHDSDVQTISDIVPGTPPDSWSKLAGAAPPAQACWCCSPGTRYLTLKSRHKIRSKLADTGVLVQASWCCSAGPSLLVLQSRPTLRNTGVLAQASWCCSAGPSLLVLQFRPKLAGTGFLVQASWCCRSGPSFLALESWPKLAGTRFPA
ncbi:hypothetical protein J6590_051938 [Homalodisca vitripennis]|nr:hypothetical protein J6590_051938 [Homalodisca vitripennis]